MLRFIADNNYSDKVTGKVLYLLELSNVENIAKVRINDFSNNSSNNF